MEMAVSSSALAPMGVRLRGAWPQSAAPSSTALLSPGAWGSSCKWIFGETLRAGRIVQANRVDAGRFLSSRFPPSCRSKSRNASTTYRKTQAKKLVEDNPGDDVRDLQGKMDSLPINEGTVTRDFGGNGSGKVALHLQSSLTSVAPEGNPNVVEASPAGVSVNDLMLMIKEAEKNIILLNQVRARALEELEHMKCKKEDLQGQVNVLQARLAEADAKIKLADQVKEKNKILEEELVYLQVRLAEKEEESKEFFQLDAELKSLQDQSQFLASRLEDSNTTGAQLNEMSSQTEAYKDEIKVLRLSVADLKGNDFVVEQLVGEKRSLQEYSNSLEVKLAEIEQRAGDIARMEANEITLKKEVEQLKAQLVDESDQESITPPLVYETLELQKQLHSLQDALTAVDFDKSELIATQSENLILREQVSVLRQKLVETERDIRQQLELYQGEVEAFQLSLEGLKNESGLGTFQVPVGEMPWDFWSNLLLRIDALLLGKHLVLEDALELRIMAWRRESRIRDAYVAVQNDKDADVTSGLLELINLKKKPGYHVVHIAAEMAPVAKVGGLGDVVTGLGKALQKKGHLVEIILPKYDCMDYSCIKNLKVLDIELYSYFDGQTHKNKIWLGIVEGLPVYFIEPHHPAKFFWRGQFYGENDDFKRFTYFCRAALEFLLQSGKRPDMIHTHDWQTAAVAPLYWDVYVPQGMASARLAFTCHNFEYQGADFPAALASCGLNVQQLHRQDRMQDSYHHHRINLLKGGVVFSNIVTTVSPTYAQEVRSPEAGRGLHLTLGQHIKKFVGILNGIDDEVWDPETDPLLEFQFSVDDLSGKFENKAALRSRLNLEAADANGDRPMVAVITRLVPQKGVHLIRHALYRTLESGGQFILLGSSPITNIQREFEGLAKHFEHHPHVRLLLKYDEGLSHSIYAASDIFVIPSLFEPCGLTQMISMRYGSIPVVRKTGGLADSVFDADDGSIPEDTRNGFTFSVADEAGLNFALDRAISHYNNDKTWWEKLVRTAMRMNFSWEKSADQYVDLYRISIERAKAQI